MNSYEVRSFAETLRGNAYPGRGILLGLTPDALRSVAVYFIMGRSVNSRNRVFLPEPDGIRTEAYDPKLLKDPSLILYHPVRTCGEYLIVTNGDQTDTVKEYLEKGLDFEKRASHAMLRTGRPQLDAAHIRLAASEKRELQALYLKIRRRGRHGLSSPDL